MTENERIKQLLGLDRGAPPPAGGPMRDHRSLCVNTDDLLRCGAVPAAKGANFRDLHGVVTNKPDGAPLGEVYASN